LSGETALHHLKRQGFPHQADKLEKSSGLQKTPPLGAERRGGAANSRVRSATETGQLNGNIAEILLLAGYFSSRT